MRSEILALPLLALARGVLASPCLPPLTSSSPSVTTTASSEAVSRASTESTIALTTTESTTAAASESTASATLPSAPVTAAPEPFYVTIFRPFPGPGQITAPITVTTIAPQGDQPGISTDQFYAGQQPGIYGHSDNILGEYWGIYQPIDNTHLIVGGRYLVTMRIRVPDNSCLDLMVAPSVGNGGYMVQGSPVINVNDAVDNWLEVRAMFWYNRQALILNDPGVAIVSSCESVSFWVDDVG
ncbi:hypothetical protein CEP53_005053 [Fusarium sp. AF-6]|nr:hypothetical protein CEP53_005053 [Fusarium sp. AF-6]